MFDGTSSNEITIWIDRSLRGHTRRSHGIEAIRLGGSGNGEAQYGRNYDENFHALSLCK